IYHRDRYHFFVLLRS
ncbi:hypothetical protein D039_0033B, partial [Vibrio parahaemolyticus EKP-028]